MLDPDCVAAIATGLTDCLHDDECDLSTAPEFQLIFLSQPPQPPTLTYLTIDEKVWRAWAADRKLPTVVSAEECTDLLIATAGGWLPGLGWQPDATLVGCSLMYDEPTAETAGTNAAATRVVVANDTDGTLYQATSVPGDTRQAVVVGGEAADTRIAAVATALTTILDNRIVGVIQLPTTGYIILHTVHRDGEEAYEVQTFIDSANTMDDERATARVQDELTQLRQHAPSNVVHTLRLVHRTETGDRDVWAAEPVRGNGPPRA
jgi:hypothetical protein